MRSCTNIHRPIVKLTNPLHRQVSFNMVISTERRDATEEEIANYRLVARDISATVCLVAFTGAVRKAMYYNLTVTWRASVGTVLLENI